MKPKLTISIVTWNSADSIEACIDSILQQTFYDYELIIVDNNSSDKTSHHIRKYNDHRIQFTQLSTNTGYCGGHNITIQNSKSEFVLLVNPDVVLTPNYISNALISIQKDETIGTLCGLLLQGDINNNNVPIDGAGLQVTRTRRMLLRYHEKKLNTVHLKRTEVFGSDGALPLYRRKMIEDISINQKFFDEMFFAHKEDWDVSWRAHLQGWKTIFDPICVAKHPRHFKPGSLQLRKSISNTIKYHTIKNQLLLHIKNENKISVLDFSLIIIRQVSIFIYLLFYERQSLKAYTFIVKNRRQILSNRQIIQSKVIIKGIR